MRSIVRKQNWTPILIIILVAIISLYFNYKIDHLEPLRDEQIILANNFSENVEKIKPAVVMILAETNRSELPFTGGEYIPLQNKIFSKGTGFIVTEDGYILTANHIIREAKDKILAIINQKFYEAKLISFNNDADIALIKIDGNRFPHVVLGEYDKFNEGLDIGFIGFPLSMTIPLTTNGIISSKGRFQYNKDRELVDIYTINAFINQGIAEALFFRPIREKLLASLTQERVLSRKISF